MHLSPRKQGQGVYWGNVGSSPEFQDQMRSFRNCVQRQKNSERLILNPRQERGNGNNKQAEYLSENLAGGEGKLEREQKKRKVGV